MGADRIGGTVASLATGAGYHVVLFNSREPETLSDLASRLGPNARPSAPCNRGRDLVPDRRALARLMRFAV